MFKLTLKLLALTLLVTAGLLLVSGSQASALNWNCPNAPGANWGNKGIGPSEGAMGSMTLKAVDTSNGDPLNVNYTLNSTLPGNSNPQLDKRIFKWPLSSDIRDNQHDFATGEHLGDGQGGFNCNGWSQFGPGRDVNGQMHVGNGWVLDCGGAGLGEGASRFWISRVENPGGAQGKWKLIKYDGNGEQVLSSDVNNDPNVERFGVFNGDNITLRLEWTPKPPPPPPDQGICNYLDVWNEGTYTNAGGDHPTRAHVQVTGVTGVSENGGGADWNQHGIDGYAPDRNGDSTFKDKIWRYTAEQPTITITVTKQFQGNDGNWYPQSGSIAGGWGPNTYTCISTSCIITSVADYNGRPGGIILAGDQVVVTGRIFNTSPRDGPNLNWPYLTGTGGNSTGAGVLAPGGDYGDVTLTATAPGGPGNWDLNYSVAGVPATATCPTFTVPVYQYFTSPLGGQVTLTPTSENPDTATYNTTVNVSGTGGPVNIPTSSLFFKQPIAGPQQNINAGNGGSYPPPTAFSGSYGIPAGSFQAGDKFCVSINAAFTSGYVGPGGNVIYPGTDGGPTNPPPWCQTIGNKPFFKVYGSGVSASNGVSQTNGSCSANVTNSGLLAGWNDNFDGPGNDRGSGSQLSALALIKITGVASAQTDITRSPTDLTFANTNPGDISTSRESPSLGGNYGGTPVCNPPPSRKTPTTNIPASPASVDTLPASANGNYQYNGNLILGGGTVNGPTAIYVNGDVYINGPITYNQAGWAPGTIPSLELIATGNIYIDPGVTQLDGVYIAQPKDATHGGIIYTCASPTPSASDPYSVNSDYIACHNQLLVNGSFTASKVKLLRTFGSLRDETPVGGSPPGAQLGLAWDTAGPPSGPLPAGMSCTYVNEPSDPYTWNDNYLCVPAGAPLNMAWTHYYNSPFNDPNKDPGKNDPGMLNEDYWKSQGFKYCTKWDIPPAYDHTWQDNELCMKEHRPDGSPLVQFSSTNLSATDPSQFCTTIKETADPQGTWATTGYFLCEPKGAPAIIGGTPAAPACSNKGIQMVTQTCAAEVFQFTPELYLTVPAPQPPSKGATQYDAITSLPPVL